MYPSEKKFIEEKYELLTGESKAHFPTKVKVVLDHYRKNESSPESPSKRASVLREMIYTEKMFADITDDKQNSTHGNIEDIPIENLLAKRVTDALLKEKGLLEKVVAEIKEKKPPYWKKLMDKIQTDFVKQIERFWAENSLKLKMDLDLSYNDWKHLHRQLSHKMNHLSGRYNVHKIGNIRVPKLPSISKVMKDFNAHKDLHLRGTPDGFRFSPIEILQRLIDREDIYQYFEGAISSRKFSLLISGDGFKINNKGAGVVNLYLSPLDLRKRLTIGHSPNLVFTLGSYSGKEEYYAIQENFGEIFNELEEMKRGFTLTIGYVPSF